MVLSVISASAVVAVGSCIIGEVTWKILETLADRAEVSFDQTMTILQKNFNQYVQNEFPDKKIEVWEFSTWARNGIVTPPCPHQDESKRGGYSFLECSEKKLECSNQRKKIQESYQAFRKNQMNLIGIANSETKWICVALIIGIATALFSAVFILPAGTALGAKIGFVIAGSFVGALSAASATLSRIKGCGATPD